jgi:hypothetical protein
MYWIGTWLTLQMKMCVFCSRRDKAETLQSGRLRLDSASQEVVFGEPESTDWGWFSIPP